MKVDNKRLTKKVNIRIGIGDPTTLAFQRRKHMSLPLVLSTRGPANTSVYFVLHIL